MIDETRKNLKLFGVAVTDFEAESQRLESVAAELSRTSSADQIGKLLKDVTQACLELNNRWLETTQRIFQAQNRLLARCAEAATKLAD